MNNLQAIWPKLQAAGVRWVPGAVNLDGYRLCECDLEEDGTVAGWADKPVPDINDLPTVYALLGELRRVTGKPRLIVAPHIDEGLWHVWDEPMWEGGPSIIASGPTEGAAVITALCSCLGVE